MPKYSIFYGEVKLPVEIHVEVTEGMTQEDEKMAAQDVYDNGDGYIDWSGAEYEDLEWEGYEEDE